MATTWVKFDKSARTFELSIRKTVMLCRYKRPQKKHKIRVMDPEMRQFFGKVGVIVQISPEERDKDEFLLVWVFVKNAKGEEVRIQWRFVSLKKERQHGI